MEFTREELIMIHDSMCMEEEMRGCEPEEYPPGDSEKYGAIRKKIMKYIKEQDKKVIFKQ